VPLPEAPNPHAAGDGVTLARIVRPRGRRGEVAAEILTDFPERLLRLAEVCLRNPARPEAPRRIAVRRCWLHGGQAIFHFEGSDSISDAEKFVGLEVVLPLVERAPLAEGSYYFSDLIGCEVYEVKGVEEVKEVEEKTAPAIDAASHNSRGVSSSTSFTSSTSFLGLVREVLLYGPAPLLAVNTPEGELLIPFAAEICTRIDLAARRIEVRLPAGLRDLNLKR
jgi:16S rRNA processing protein RimM